MKYKHVFVGVKENDLTTLKSIKLFPNPCNEKLFIENNFESNLKEFTIYNSLGIKKLHETFNNGKIHEIDVSNFPTGIYYLKSDNQIEEYQIIR